MQLIHTCTNLSLTTLNYENHYVYVNTHALTAKYVSFKMKKI